MHAAEALPTGCQQTCVLELAGTLSGGVAATLGVRCYSAFAIAGGKLMKLGKTTPILRIFDEGKAKAFYLDFLGFRIDFEHRFEDEAPLYLGISRGTCAVHLSEHHGDCCPGAAVRIETDDLNSYHRELAGKQYKYNRPGIHEMPWGSRDMTVIDPFGNKLTFTEASGT